MKITNIIAIASAAVLIVACGAPKVEGSAEVKALLPSAKQIDSASYLMGVNIGSFLKGNDFGEVDYNLFIKGIKDFVNAKGDMRDSTFNDQFKISPEKMNEVLDPFLQKRRAYRTALNGEKGAQYIEKFLTGLVVLMGLIFLVCAFAYPHDWGQILRNLFIPSVPDSEGGRSWMTVAALMGTTVVPYNIYLHASSSAKKWSDPEVDIKTSNLDSILAIGLGGLISMAIIICASILFGNYDPTGANGKTMAQSLSPLLGSWATVIFGIGLFAAGFSSAITAPLSAAFASSGILGWGEDMKKFRFKIIWMIVLIFGIVAVCTIGKSPTEIILFAQAANAFLLPITGILLLIACNDKNLMGKYKNGVIINILAIIVIGVFLFIAARNMTAFVDSAKALFAA